MPGTRKAVVLLATALALGVAADILTTNLRGRLDIASWIALAMIAGLALVERGVVQVPRQSFALGGVALVFTLALVGRDAGPLFALNFLVVLSCLVLAAPRAVPQAIATAGVTDYVRAAIDSAGNTLAGVLPALGVDIEWSELGAGTRRRSFGAAAAGFVVVVPVLILFGTLLGRADPVFQRAVAAIIPADFERVADHLSVIAVATWLAAGFLRWAFTARPYAARAVPATGRIGFAAIGTAVGAVAFLFLAFVVVQARYLFGGEALVTSLTGLSYAEYARQGFFELAWVAGLSLPLLLLAEWLLDKTEPRRARAFRAMAAVVLILLSIIIGSALYRMGLYVSAYGLTELRFYVTAFMVWLAAIFGWFALTVLRGRREHFATGAFFGGVAAVALLNLVNPEAIIARTNLARAAAGARFDAGYLASLSADALPTVVAALPSLGSADRCEVASRLHRRWRGHRAVADWDLSLVRAASDLRVAQAGGGGECAGAGGKPG